MCHICRLEAPEGVTKCVQCGRSLPAAPPATIIDASSVTGRAPAVSIDTPCPPAKPAAFPPDLPSAPTLQGLDDTKEAASTRTVKSASGVTRPVANSHITPTATPPPPSQIQPRLLVIRGEQPDVVYPILAGRNLIGRSADQPVDIDLDGQEPVERIWTSRHHAVVTFDRGSLMLEDLNSLNGTFINRQRIYPGQVRPLKAGDVVQIGTVQLRVLT